MNIDLDEKTLTMLVYDGFSAWLEGRSCATGELLALYEKMENCEEVDFSAYNSLSTDPYFVAYFQEDVK